MKRNSSPLQRKTPLKRTSFVVKRRKADIPKSVRDEVKERSGGLCEIRATGCDGRATDMHHVLRRSKGGKHDAGNLLHLCWSCHHVHVHAHPLWAKEYGYLR